MTTFYLDGQSHAVEPEDICFVEGPCKFNKGTKQLVKLLKGDTLTILFERFERGDMMWVTHDHLSPTIFYRALELEAETHTEKMEKV